jgi:hypothetical protein
MSRTVEDQEVLRFNCLGDFFPQITISGPSVLVATSLSGTLNLLRKIHIGTGQMIVIPEKTTIREFFIRNPDVIL